MESTPLWSCRPLLPNTIYGVCISLISNNLSAERGLSWKHHPNRTNLSPADLSFDLLTERSQLTIRHELA